MAKTNTQCSRILRHLNEIGGLTAYEAVQQYGIMQLATRISDLKKKGYFIIGEPEESENRYGEKVHFKRYRLVSEDEYKEMMVAGYGE